ncbi:nitroreductase family deazaflavin-dependent oxidoreductase [Pseudonocardia sp. H11422]|uniref:nitroreductase family deazaflavin-dependent oxidoreductase n=1 Tax=Pseudonocardia sp. H11422 TaxID=2835866 RepID=UPI001BDCBE49|nr:nitroreductase family deazaflavin-dependent oxidoreductase [Pseudonocardia sp. H11422]
MAVTATAFKNALTGTPVITITVTDRRSGRQISHPVNFVQEGDALYLLPLRGSDTEWYKNVLKTPTVRLAANGAEYTARAVPITDIDRVREIVGKFRAKYGDAEMTYYSTFDVAVEIPLT